MKIKSISFENYKAFKLKQTVVIKPITILIGKNSSGKSSIAKLLPLLENSLSGKIKEPHILRNNGVELGAEFIDLVYGKQNNDPVKYSIIFEDESELSVSIIQENNKYDLQILDWSYSNKNGKISLSYHPEKGYVDTDGNIYEATFMGFVPKKILNSKKEDVIEKLDIKLRISVDYIGPFRILPDRQFYLSGQRHYKEMGIKGENAYSMLGLSKLVKKNLHESVGEWYKKHFDDWELKVIEKKPFYEIVLSKNNIDVNIVDVGQGMNQALPLVVRSFTKKDNSVIILEQPELHLHPAAHGDLAELFASKSKPNNQSFLIETHSENILLRLRTLIIKNDFGFTKDDIIIYWVDDAEEGGQKLTEITINEEGTLSYWPDGIFNENLDEIVAMRKALASVRKTN